MFKKTFIILTSLFIFQQSQLWGLAKPDFEQAYDAIITQQSEITDPDALHELLWHLYQHPLDLNDATREALEQLGLLTDNQINHFFTHMHQNGPLVSIYELQAIPAFDPTTIHLILPFVQVHEFYPHHPAELKKMGLKSGQTGYALIRYARTLETKAGYLPHPKKGTIPYLGSPDQVITRLKYSDPKGWSLGLAARKNAGEAFTWDHSNARYGFNLYSGYLQLQDKSYFKQIVFGTYQIGYGQGLVANAGFSIDKSSDAIPSARTNNRGIKPHAQPNADRLSGIAATLNLQNWTQTFYYAYNLLDAKLQIDKKTQQPYIRSITKNSIYQTQNALDKKDRVIEQLIGTTLVYQNKPQNLELGINTLYNHYDLPIQPDTTKQMHQFSGQHHYNASVFYRYVWRNLHWFGEGATAKTGGKAVIMGVIASLSAKTDASLVMRHYDPHFSSPYGKAFRKNTTANSNEQGIYLGFSFQPIKKVRLATYCDYFRFPQPKPKIPEPISGYDWLTKATYQPSKQTLWLLQHTLKNKAKNVPLRLRQHVKDKKPWIEPSHQNKLKAQLKHTLSRYLDLTTISQWSHHQIIDQSSWGYGIMQKARYKIRQWRIIGQIAWFDTDTDNQLYFPESNGLYSSNLAKAYQKIGIKYYVLLAYKATASWRFECKYAFTWLYNASSIGSGLEKITGNKKNEIKFQAIYQF